MAGLGRIVVVLSDEDRELFRQLLEPLEDNQALPESCSTACSGAGCPSVEQEPRAVLGPAEIIAKLKSYIKSEIKVIDDSELQGWSPGYVTTTLEKILQQLEQLTGTESQDAT